MRRTWIIIVVLLVIVTTVVLLTIQKQSGVSPSVASMVASPTPTSIELVPTLGEEAIPAGVVLTPTVETKRPAVEPVLPPGVAAGVVQDDKGPLRGAVVRVRATDNQTLSGADGSFSLTVLDPTEPISVTAWLAGYYGGGVTAVPGTVPITITLNQYHTTDNVQYRFASVEECEVCHLNYPEWQADAHAQAAINPRFLTMYLGTDVQGNESVVTRDTSGLPLPPQPDQPYYGPGFKVDYPDRAGNCAACHTPMASSLETDNTCGWSGCHSNFTASMSDQVPYGVSPTNLTGVAAEGITCDFCHKIGDVILDAETNLPWAAKPGISSMQIYRPPEGFDLFLGTFDDVPGKDSYLPLQEESAYCAPCHYGVFDGVVGSHDVTGGIQVYNSYGEWLDSPYSDPVTGQTCQDCHMPTVDYEYVVYPENGGWRRDPNRIHNHRMPGASDEALLQNSVTMTPTASIEENEVRVAVSITNDKTGHHVPTGVPLRQMILVVEARDADGNVLPLHDGPTLPDWTGDFAAQAGRYYAKILEDEWTGEVPTSAFWRNIRLVEDTRLPALATDVSQYIFEAPTAGSVTVETHLIYRRAFQQLMDQKGWDDPDILMEEDVIVVTVP